MCQETQMKHDYILLVSIGPVENRVQIVECVVVPNHHQYVTGTNTDDLRCQVLTRL
jgi:hypothetical protein